jgi:transcriptional regulator NrdR family protein
VAEDAYLVRRTSWPAFGAQKREGLMDCPECGEELFRISRLCHDREGIRDNEWCEECKIMFACYAHGLVKRLVLKDIFESNARDRIVNLLQRALKEVKGE